MIRPFEENSCQSRHWVLGFLSVQLVLYRESYRTEFTSRVVDQWTYRYPPYQDRFEHQ